MTSEDGDLIRAGLAYVRGKLPRRVYVLKELESKKRLKVKLPVDMTTRNSPTEWVDQEVEVLNARG